jgi:hypothetical protein
MEREGGGEVREVAERGRWGRERGRQPVVAIVASVRVAEEGRVGERERERVGGQERRERERVAKGEKATGRGREREVANRWALSWSESPKGPETTRGGGESCHAGNRLRAL